jgi:hypothetical protein
MKLATVDIETRQDLASNLLDIVERLDSTEKRLVLFPADVDLLKQVIKLFAAVLHYVVKAIFFLQRPKPLRAIIAASGSSVKFRKMFADVDRNTASVERRFSIAAETRQYHFFSWNPVLYNVLAHCGSSTLLV